MAILAPSAAKRRAIAFPIPLVPPVMRTVLFSKIFIDIGITLILSGNTVQNKAIYHASKILTGIPDPVFVNLRNRPYYRQLLKWALLLLQPMPSDCMFVL